VIFWWAGWLACTPTVEDTTSTSGTTPTVAPDPELLSALGLLSWDGAAFAYAEGMEPYVLATPLFSDFALKARAVQLPEGTSASYVDNAVLDFPIGTVIVKSFLYPADLRVPTEDLRVIETRVLTLLDDGWDAWPYVWNEEQTDAVRAPSGDVTELSFVDLDGETVTFPYLIPQRNQCLDCHELSLGEERAQVPIGTKARHLNVDGQLEYLADQGLLTGLPPIDTVPVATDAAALHGVDLATLADDVVDAAARDYLDINCAHCHNPSGEEGRSSQLYLNWDNTDLFSVGVCKRPGSAGGGTGGLTFDIVPGQPEQSILWYRMQTAEIGEMMPDIGRALVDDAGVALIAEWIRRMEGTCSE
jgi:uncharacterized repeat protein (TIGR03806 family)